MEPRAVSWIETELKLLLPDEAAWRRVRAALAPGRKVIQQNHFFDRADAALRAARIGVRLREEAGRATLTVKADRAAASAGAVTTRIELESEFPAERVEGALRDGLDLLPWIARWRGEQAVAGVDPELAAFFAGLETLVDGERLALRMAFVNEREALRLPLRDAEGPFEVELALDRTSFPGGRVDHEIEVELEVEKERAADFVARVERAVRAWLASLGGIEGRPAPSKLARLDAVLAVAGQNA